MIAPLFDGLLGELIALTSSARPLSLREWEDAGRRNLVLQSEMAYELGAGRLPAVSVFAATPGEAVPEGNRAYLLGPDLPAIGQNGPYARAALLRVKPELWQEESGLYTALTSLRNLRYSVSPRGYMARVDSNQGREPVRVSREALSGGLTFSGVAHCYAAAYFRRPEVLGLTQIFVTDPAFDYAHLTQISLRSGEIIAALDHILKDFKMDCSTCKLQTVCNEVEGLREIHFKNN